MFICCLSAKGGVGVTVVVAALGVCLAENRPGSSGVTLVDLGGDLPAVLGLPGVDRPGVSSWLAAGDDVPPEGLDRVTVPVGPGLHLVPRGSEPWPSGSERASVLVELLAARSRRGPVIVDIGRVESIPPPLIDVLLARADRRVLVTRACFVSLCRTQELVGRATDLVLIEEEGRALDRVDVSSALGLPLAAVIPVDPAVARSVDSGLLARRLPRPLRRPIERLAGVAA